MNRLRIAGRPPAGHVKKQRGGLLLFVAILSCILSTTSCSPNFVQVYPNSAPGESVSIGDSLEQLKKDKHIRFKVAGEPTTEAIYRERDTQAIYVTLFEWKKQLVGKKKVKSDEVTRIPVTDLEQLHVVRPTTVHKIVVVVAVGAFVGAVYAMAAPSE